MTTPAPHPQTFFAAKGGQGTTVVAAAAALAHARAGRATLLIDAAEHHDTYAVLGMPEPADPTELVTVTTNLELRSIDPGADPHNTDGYDVVIIDAGQHPSRTGGATLVTRACYLALRRAVAIAPAPAAVILLQEPGRALTRDDVAAVLSIPVIATIPVDPAVARVVDAGLLVAGLPAALDHLRAATITPQTSMT